MKNILLFLFVPLVSVLNAQPVKCGFDLMLSDQQSAQNAHRFDEMVRSKRLPDQGMRISGVPLEIPVVVHIVHNNGNENLPDSVIVASIDQLNQRFANTGTYYDSTGTDVQVIFCLASVDPFGNPTTGITRTVSSFTNLGSFPAANDLSLKNLVRWEPQLYLNIWVIASIVNPPGIAGYATYPGNAGSPLDGIVAIHSYLNTPLLAHEAGHYLGLRHTFEGGGCMNENCQFDGDLVCDTPPDSTSDQLCPFNSCNTELTDTSGFSPFIADAADSKNYMDYTSCRNVFTPGQSDRMNDGLSLMRTTLLQSNGCGQNPGGPVPIPSFTFTAGGCAGHILTNTSINSVGAYWDMNDDGTIETSGNVVSLPFPLTGSYDVTMYATGYGGVASITQNVFVQVGAYQNFPLAGFTGIGPLLTTNEVGFCMGATVTLTGEPGMASYLWSTGDTTQIISFVPTQAFSISLTAIDTAGLTWSTCTPVEAVPAPPVIPPVISIAGSDTSFCAGDTVTLNLQFSPISLFRQMYTSTGIITGINDSTYTTVLAQFNTFYLIQTDSNSCNANSAPLVINADYPMNPFSITQNGDTLTTQISFVHVNWYIDGVLIPNYDSTTIVMDQTGCYAAYGWYMNYDCGAFSTDTFCITISGIEAINLDNPYFYPNPASDHIKISNYSGPFEIHDIPGHIILRGESKPGSVINVSSMKKGVYFLRISERSYKLVLVD